MTVYLVPYWLKLLSYSVNCVSHIGNVKATSVNTLTVQYNSARFTFTELWPPGTSPSVNLWAELEVLQIVAHVTRCLYNKKSIDLDNYIFQFFKLIILLL